jgi:MoxR-like ATPase
MPYHADLPSLDIRRFVAHFGPDVAAARAALARLLRRTGHRPTDAALRVLVEALRSGKPLLAEGPPGCGKTALALSLAEVCNLPVFKLPCGPGVLPADLLYAWNEAAQRISLERDRDPDDKEGKSVRTSDFLILGVITQAFVSMHTHPCPLILLDEADKLDPRLGDALLECLSEWRVTIPALQPNPWIAIPDGESPPIVILTSNAMYGGLSRPLRQRSLYLSFPPPDDAERLRILAARVPTASPDLLNHAMGLFAVIAADDFISEKPDLRNQIAFLAALADKEILRPTPDDFIDHVMYLASNPTDQETFRTDAARFIRAAADRAKNFHALTVAALDVRAAETASDDDPDAEIEDWFDRFPAVNVYERRAYAAARTRTPAQTAELDTRIRAALEELENPPPASDAAFFAASVEPDSFTLLN